MGLDRRQFDLLQALVRKESELRDAGQPLYFLLLQMPGPSFGLKPGIDKEHEIRPSEGDIYDLEGEGFVRSLPATSESVVVKFVLTAEGRSAVQPRAATPEVDRPSPSST